MACSRARLAARLLLILALLLGVRAAFGANSPPVANPDSYTVNEDTTLSISSPGVLANDTDAEGNSLSTVLVSNVTYGTLTLNSGGSFTYRPSTNYNGGDSFIYRAKDSSGTSAPVTVTITINPTNDVPRATNDAYAVDSDTTLNISVPGVLGNDFDPDEDELHTILTTNVTHGTLSLSTNGSFTYTPAAGYAGNDSFAYRAVDGKATSAVAVATLNVIPAPIVVTAPPLNQTNCVGHTAVFSVTATGTALKFQWLKGTTTLTGQTNSTLVLPNLVTGDAGTYRVRLTGATNSITNSATLTISTPISALPMTNLLRFVGSIAIFNSTASGPATYSWLRDGVLIPGEASSTLVLSNLAVGESGIYAAVIYNACGSVTNSATLEVASCFPSVDVMLVIDRSASMLGQPYNDARTACTNFVRNLKYGPTNDMAGFVIYNPTSSLRVPLTNDLAVLEQTVAGFPAATGGTCISCGLTNAQGALFSPRHRSNALPVMVLMSDGLPKVEDGDSPSNVLYFAQQAKNAGTRIFTVGLGAVDFSLMAAAASSTNDFFYTTNSSQLSALFDTISSIICRPPTNILGPVDATVCAGGNVSFNVTASGCDDAFTFQWRKGGTPLPGQTN
ncbi:MAG TPA: Ig-like domain-containing protein, partial [Verrucomicrobiae bacterium]